MPEDKKNGNGKSPDPGGTVRHDPEGTPKREFSEKTDRTIILTDQKPKGAQKPPEKKDKQ